VVYRIGHNSNVRKKTHRAYALSAWQLGGVQRNILDTIVHSASVGGAASNPLDPSVRVAPMRDATYITAAELREARAHAAPWDPWPAQRIGYDTPAPASLFLPQVPALERLRSYLGWVS